MNAFINKSVRALILGGFFSFAAILSTVGCNKANSNNKNMALLGLLASPSTSGCSSGNVAAIPASTVTCPWRNQYTVSSGDSNFTSNFTVDSASSPTQIASKSTSLIPAGGNMNVEITFTLGSGSLNIMTYGNASGSSITGASVPTVTIGTSGVPACSTSVACSLMTTGSTLPTSGTQTYCIDFDLNEGGSSMIQVWPYPCANVASGQRDTMMHAKAAGYMAMFASPSRPGLDIGFALNGGATLSSFTVGTMIYNGYH